MNLFFLFFFLLSLSTCTCDTTKDKSPCEKKCWLIGIPKSGTSTLHYLFITYLSLYHNITLKLTADIHHLPPSLATNEKETFLLSQIPKFEHIWMGFHLNAAYFQEALHRLIPNFKLISTLRDYDNFSVSWWRSKPQTYGAFDALEYLPYYTEYLNEAYLADAYLFSIMRPIRPQMERLLKYCGFEVRQDILDQTLEIVDKNRVAIKTRIIDNGLQKANIAQNKEKIKFHLKRNLNTLYYNLLFAHPDKDFLNWYLLNQRKDMCDLSS